MDCPICKADTVVLHKAGLDRRRRCTRSACGYRFTTTEVMKVDHQERERLLQDAVRLAERIAAGG